MNRSMKEPLGKTRRLLTQNEIANGKGLSVSALDRRMRRTPKSKSLFNSLMAMNGMSIKY